MFYDKNSESTGCQLSHPDKDEIHEKHGYIHKSKLTSHLVRIMVKNLAKKFRGPGLEPKIHCIQLQWRQLKGEFSSVFLPIFSTKNKNVTQSMRTRFGLIISWNCLIVGWISVFHWCGWFGGVVGANVSYNKTWQETLVIRNKLRPPLRSCVL